MPEEVSLSERFSEMLKLGFLHLSRKDFSKALALYNELDDVYESLNEPEKERFRERFEDFFRELELYVRVNEAFLASERGDLSRLRNELDTIHNITFEVEQIQGDERPVFDYVQEKYRFLLRLHKFKSGMKKFNELVSEARKRLENGGILDAKKIYSEAVIVYHKTAGRMSHINKLRCYNEMKSLFRDINAHSLMQKKSVKVKPIKEVARKKVMRMTAKKIAKKNSMANIRRLIAKGKIDEAERLM